MAQSSYHLHHGNKREPNFMEFSWYTVVIVLTHENNRDSHFMDHENAVKGHEITKKIFMDH